MFKVILAVSFLLLASGATWFLREFTYSTTNENQLTILEPRLIIHNDTKQSGDNGLNDIPITKVIYQYFNFATEGRFEEISRIVVNPPNSRGMFIDVERATKISNKKVAIPNASSSNSKNRKTKEIFSQPLKDSGLGSITTKKLFPEFVHRNKLSIKNIRIIWLRDTEVKAEVNAAEDEQNNLLQTIYFYLTKNEKGEWGIFEVDLIDPNANE